MVSTRVLFAAFIVVAAARGHVSAQRLPNGQPQARTLPILDMHMHAREAAHYGATGMPLTIEWKARRISGNARWVAVAIPDGDVTRRWEIVEPGD